VIDVRRQQLLPHAFDLEHRTAYDAVVTVDGRALLTTAEEEAALWDLATGAPLSEGLFQAAAGVGAMDVHPNGRLAALSVHGSSVGIQVIDLATGELVATPDFPDVAGERIGLAPVVFSPDGRWLAAASWGGRVVVWDTRSWRLHNSWQVASSSSVDSLAFTPDSQFLIAGEEGAASIRPVDKGGGSGVTLDVDPLRPEASVSVGARDAGRTIVTFTAGTGVHTWNVEQARLVEHACTVANRNLTEEEWTQVLPDRPYERTCAAYPNGR
jgi:WD40 repeat protein